MWRERNPDKDAMANEPCSDWRPRLILFAAGDELDVVEQSELAAHLADCFEMPVHPRKREGIDRDAGRASGGTGCGSARELPRKPGRRAGPRGRGRLAAKEDRRTASRGLDVSPAGLERGAAGDDRLLCGNVWPAIAAASRDIRSSCTYGSRVGSRLCDRFECAGARGGLTPFFQGIRCPHGRRGGN